MAAPAPIRPATPADLDALASLAATAFRETYRPFDDAAEIEDYIAGHLHRDAFAAVLADPAATLQVLPDRERGALAGYVVVRSTPAPACITGPAPIELGRLYLAPGLIGRGLGSALMQAAFAEARRRGGRTMWLSLHERNARGRAFYRRCGFSEVGTTGFAFGGRIVIDPVMAAAVPPAPADGG